MCMHMCSQGRMDCGKIKMHAQLLKEIRDKVQPNLSFREGDALDIMTAVGEQNKWFTYLSRLGFFCTSDVHVFTPPSPSGCICMFSSTLQSHHLEYMLLKNSLKKKIAFCTLEPLFKSDRFKKSSSAEEKKEMINAVSLRLRTICLHTGMMLRRKEKPKWLEEAFGCSKEGSGCHIYS